MHLFVASYNGTISTLELIQDASNNYSLGIIASTTICGPNPSWITLDLARDVLYCTEPGMKTGAGTLYSLSVQPNGSLILLDSLATPIGAAHSALHSYNQALAVAYYHGGCIGVYTAQDFTSLDSLQVIKFPFSTPGPDPIQTQPRPHQIIIDPTGQYLLVSDLGSDLIRIFKIYNNNGLEPQIVLQQNICLRPGSTPRHGAFATFGRQTYFFLVNQNINTLTAFSVEYRRDGMMRFEELAETNLLLRMDGSLMKGDIKASHILISPDQRFLMISLRNDSSFSIPSPLDPDINIPADSLLTYSITQNSGEIKLVDAAAAGGSFPRQFSLNETGSQVAIAVQTNGWVAIYHRDTDTGKVGKRLALQGGLGENCVVCVQWGE